MAEAWFEEVLAAELALLRGVASIESLTVAFGNWWSERDDASVLDFLDPCEDDVRRKLGAEVAAQVREAQGSPRKALERRGIDASVRSVIESALPELDRFLQENGIATRPRVREVAPGRYLDWRFLSTGGMGRIYLALDTVLNRRVAFKIPWPQSGNPAVTPASPLTERAPAPGTHDAAAYEELKAKLLQEAWITGGLDHPGVVPVHDVGFTSNEVPYYTMRFVPGGDTLAEVLARVAAESFDERQRLLEPFLRLCDTVEYAHANGVIHRDLKPDNVVLGEHGEVVLIDWGLASVERRQDDSPWRLCVRQHGEEANLETHRGSGTPGYMAPEAAAQRGDPDARSDVYGLGVILFQILTGRLPFEFGTPAEFIAQVVTDDPPSPASVRADVPQALAKVCLQALAREPDRRTPSAKQLAREIRDWQADSARERAVEIHLESADLELSNASTEDPRDAPKSLDRAAASIQQAADQKFDEERVGLAQERLRAARASVERAQVRRFRRRIAMGMGLVAVAALGVMLLILREVKRAEAQRTIERDRRAARSGLIEAGLTDLAAGRRTSAATRLLEAKRLRASGRGFEFLVAQATSRLPHVLQHGDSLARVAISPDGKRAATGDVKGNLFTWDLRDRATSQSLKGHANKIRWLGFSADGTRLFSASLDGTVRVWNPESGNEVRLLDPKVGGIFGATWTDDKRVLAAGTETGRVVVWELDDPDTPTVVDLPTRKAIRSVAFAPGPDRRLAVAGHEHVAWIVDSRDGSVLQTLKGHTRGVRVVAWSPDGQSVATGSNDKSVRIWDAESGASRLVIPDQEQAVWSVGFTPDGRDLIVVPQDPVPRLFDAVTGRRYIDFVGHEDLVRGHVFLGPRRLLTIGLDGSCRVWDPRTGRSLDVLDGHLGWVLGAAVAQSGRRVLTAGMQGRALLWDTSSWVWSHPGGLARSAGSGYPTSSVALGLSRRALSMTIGTGGVRWGAGEVVAEEGPNLAAQDRHGEVLAWPEGNDVRVARRGAEPPLRLEGHTKAVSGVRISPDGTRVVSVSKDATIRVWDLAGHPLDVLRGHEGTIWSVSFDPKGERLITASEDRTARIWRLGQGDAEHTLTGHRKGVFHATFSPDGRRVLTVSDDKTARIWSAGSGDLLVDYKDEHEDDVWCAAWSRASDRVVTGGADNMARLWDPAAGQTLRVFKHPLWVRAVALIWDGEAVITGCQDGKVRLWSVEDGARLATFEVGSPVYSVHVTADGGLLLASGETTGTRAFRLGRDTRTAPELEALLEPLGLGDVKSTQATSD